MKRVSIIIVTHNSEADIFDCLDSIKQYADIPLSEIEVVIVDNCSNHPKQMFQQIKQQWGEDIVLIENTQNGGYGQGNNVGIRACTAPLLLIMNPDVRLITPFFREAVEAFEQKKDLIMMGAKQMLTTTRPSTNSFAPTYMMNGYFRSVLGAISTRLEWYIPKYMYFSGSCFFVRKNMLQDVGLFDESVFMYGEEDDIRWRLMRAYGKGFVYNKKLRYLHLVSERKPSFNYEKKVADMIIYLYGKKGYEEKKTLQNLIRHTNLLIMRLKLKSVMGRADEERMEVLAQLRTYLKERQKNLSC